MFELQMGMQEMFSDNANFAALLKDSKGVRVSKVIHKAFIEVNELGTEAAAATGKQLIELKSKI